MKFFYSFIFILGILGAAKAQECNGSFGENIFLDGTFGSGSRNIPTQDPNIAPGYTYSTDPPPNDGEYTITNNTTSWGDFATGWVNIRDNSSDPNGYMMVVNASVEPGLFYQRTVEICGNTTYEFSADVISMNNPAQAGSFIKPNISFLINGEVVFSSGDVPIDGKWHTYRFSFVSAPEAAQLELAVRNNAPGGFGNDLALDNISFRPCGPTVELFDTIPFCGDRPLTIQSTLDDGFETPFFQWQFSEDGGDSWIAIPGAEQPELPVNRPEEGRQYRLLVANTPQNITRQACRIVSNFSTLAYAPRVFDLNETICRGDTYQLNGETYTEEGIYEQSLQTADGCDSLIRIDITYGNPRNFSITGDSILCDNRPAVLRAGDFAAYAWSTGASDSVLNIRRPGSYSVTVTNDLGCTAGDRIEAANSRLNAGLELTPPRCPGDPEWIIDVVNVQNGFPPFRYGLNGDPLQGTPTFDSLPPGNYDIVVQDETGCQYRESRTLNSGPPLSLELEAAPEIQLGDSLTVRVNTNRPVSSYSWSPEEGFSCTDCPSPVLRPLNSTEYQLQVADENACTAVDSFFIYVEKTRKYFAPNVFSPNGDGINDYFMPLFGKDVERVENFRVFSRWGSLLYECREAPPNSARLRWNGRQNQEVAPEELYIWMAEVLFIDGVRQTISGDVLLLR